MADITNITLNGTNYTLKASGGGGGEQVVELTQAEYDALTAYTEDTTYIITDATPINMDDYATTGTVNTLSGQVSTLSGTVATKADAANVTARNVSYLPRWNSQGIITGDSNSQVYAKDMSINGTNYSAFLRQNSNDLPSFYAPTSAGTQNTILMSNGSGSPQWSSIKMQFISQSAYDALVTKDASCIYFIISEN